MNELFVWVVLGSLPILAFVALYQFVWNLRTGLPKLPKNFAGTTKAWDEYYGRLNSSQSRVFHWFISVPAPYRKSLMQYADEVEGIMIKMGMK